MENFSCCCACPLQQRQHSYRDLPKRWAELGTVYRYERSGTMHGLFRVRGFTQVGPNAHQNVLNQILRHLDSVRPA